MKLATKRASHKLLREKQFCFLSISHEKKSNKHLILYFPSGREFGGLQKFNIHKDKTHIHKCIGEHNIQVKTTKSI